MKTFPSSRFLFGILVLLLSIFVASCNKSKNESSGGKDQKEEDPPAPENTQFSINSAAISNGRMLNKYVCGTGGGATGCDTRGYSGGQNVSPPLTWSNVPSGTKGFGLLLEATGDNSRPVRWIALFPSSVSQLPEGLNLTNTNPSVDGQTIRHQSRNGNRSRYLGPKQREGSQYNLVLFALDKAPATNQDANFNLWTGDAKVAFQAYLEGTGSFNFIRINAKILGKASLSFTYP